MSEISESHERRIRDLEHALTSIAGRDEADALRFKMISDQIEQLGKNLGGSINGLSSRVDSLAVQTAEHHTYMKTLQDAAEKVARRKKWFKRVALAAVAAVLTGVANLLGEDAWKWLAKLLQHRVFW